MVGDTDGAVSAQCGKDWRQGVRDDGATKRKRDEKKQVQYSERSFSLEAILNVPSLLVFYKGKSNSNFKSNLYCTFFTILL